MRVRVVRKEQRKKQRGDEYLAMASPSARKSDLESEGGVDFFNVRREREARTMQRHERR